MNSPKDKCPKCGSETKEYIEREVRVFACGTTQEFLDNQWGSTAQSDKCKLHALRAAAKRVLSIERLKAKMQKDYPAGTCNAEDAWKDFGRWEKESWEILRQTAIAETKDL